MTLSRLTGSILESSYPWTRSDLFSFFTLKGKFNTIRSFNAIRSFSTTSLRKMIQVKDTLPNTTFFTLKDGKPTPLSTDDVFKGKKVVLFAVPGPFTPDCSKVHLPGYVENYNKLKESGIDTIACTSVSDCFVMDAWRKERGAGDKILMLADGNAEFTKAAGLELDLSKLGLGTRSKRFAMIVEDKVVQSLEVDEKSVDVSGATCTLSKLTKY